MTAKKSNPTTMPTHLKDLEQVVKEHESVLSSAVITVVDEGVSNYPMLVVHREHIEIGIPLMQIGTEPGWMVHISTLEELSARKVMESERIDEFREIYKNPAEFLTVLYIENSEASILFIPLSHPTTS